MLENISYFLILGKPLIMYLGILTFLLLISTATLGILSYKKITKFKWHPTLGVLTLISAIIHGTLGILAYF